MNRDLDLRAVESQKDLISTSEARTRFEQNRRYDQRPAIQALERPAIVVTTRTRRTDRSPWSAGVVAAFLAGGTFLLAAGIAIGWIAQRPANEAATTVTSNEVQTTIGTQAPLATDPPAEALVNPEPRATDPVGSSAAALNQTLDQVDFTRLSFEPGTAELTPAGQVVVGDLAQLLMQAPGEPVEILVRTFSESTPGQNHGLSVRQAEVVLNALASEGVSTEHLRSVGLGSSGAERPSVSAAIRTEASDPQLAEMIRSTGPLVFDTPFTGSFNEESSIQLTMIGKFLADNPEAAVTFVGYAWNEDSAHDNHENSHQVLDAAKAHLVDNGASEVQVALVGLGEVNIQLADQLTQVVVDASPAAAIGVSLGAVPIESIEFAAGSAELTEGGSQALEAVSSIIGQDQTVRIEIAVHTYSGADSQDNHDLSQRQADAIFEFLTVKGIAPTQLELVAHGDPHHFAAPGRDGAVTFTVIR